MSQAEPSDGGMYRRDVMRRTGAGLVGAALLSAGASRSGLELVDEAEAADWDILINPEASTRVDVLFAQGVAKITPDDDDGNDLVLWQNAVSAKEWWSSYYTIMSNYLEDTSTIASTEGRHALASAWEDGKDNETIREETLTAIREYYDQRLMNHLSVCRAVLSQIGQQSHIGRNDGSLSDHIVTTGNGSYSGSASPTQGYVTGPDEETESVTWELPSGSEWAGTFPKLVVPYDNGDEYRGAPDQEWLDNYDKQNGETVLATADGETTTGDFTIGIPNLPDHDVESKSIFEPLLEFIDGVQEIKSQCTTVVGNYDQTFIDSIVSELDAGTITPNDVRGAEGLARYMSGTDDVHDSRFRLALASQLGVEQPDLSNTAHMTVTYSGATAVQRNVDPVERFPKEYVEEKQYSGMLFGNDVPGLVPGTTVVTSPTIYTADNGGGAVRAHSSSSGEVKWSYQNVDQYVMEVKVTPDGRKVLIADGSTLQCVDAYSGELLWEYSNLSSGGMSLSISSDGTFAVIAAGGLKRIDIETGSADWSIGSGGGPAISPDGSTVYATPGSSLVALDAEDGSELWSFDEAGDNLQGCGVAADGTAVYTGGNENNVYAVDPSDGTQLWSTSTAGDIVRAFGQMNPTGRAYVGSRDGNLYALDQSDGSVIWSYSGEGSPRSIAPLPGASRVFVGEASGRVAAINAEGEELWASDALDDTALGIHVMQPPAISGSTGMSYFFESATGNEVTMRDGVLTVDSMQDSDGNEIEITTDETISYIEDADGRSIEEILGEIPEIDGVDDVTSLADLELIVAEADGVDSVDELPGINTQDWEPPDYDTYDPDEYIETIKKLREDLEDALAADDDGLGGGGGGDFDPKWDWWHDYVPDILPDFFPDKILGVPTELVLLTGGAILVLAR